MLYTKEISHQITLSHHIHAAILHIFITNIRRSISIMCLFNVSTFYPFYPQLFAFFLIYYSFRFPTFIRDNSLAAKVFIVEILL